MQPVPNVGYARLAAHRMLLGDLVRTEAFQRAIEEVVRPGHTVVDVGTGSSILALFAAGAGARKVYAIEREPIIHAAKRVAAANGLDAHIEFIEADVATVQELPERADVLISECIGSAVVNTKLIEPVLAARERFLKPESTILPALAQLVACPVEVPVHDCYLRFWQRAQYGMDWSAFIPLAINQMYTAIVAEDDLLAEPQCLCELDFASPQTRNANLAGEGVFTLSRDGTLHGIALWFKLKLSPSLWLSTGPCDPLTSWYQNLLPIDQPIQVKAGTEVLIRLQATHTERRVAWTWAIEVPGLRVSVLNSELSYPDETYLGIGSKVREQDGS